MKYALIKQHKNSLSVKATVTIICSMSRTDCWYGNFIIEPFFWSLKYEQTKIELFENVAQIGAGVF